MPNNPERASRGGDVSGTTKTDVVLGSPIDVADASYDPGYEIGYPLDGVSAAELKQGFTSYGKSVGGR
jgi:hypothetical protein